MDYKPDDVEESTWLDSDQQTMDIFGIASRSGSVTAREHSIPLQRVPCSVAHLDIACLIDRLHRRYLDLIGIELTRRGLDDLSPSQVMMLLIIGLDDLSVGELIERGYYPGSNVSYNLKRLVEAEYVTRTASERDRRSARIRLSGKGLRLRELIQSIDGTYHQRATRCSDEAYEFEITFRTLRRMEQVWTDALRYGNRPAGKEIQLHAPAEPMQIAAG